MKEKPHEVWFLSLSDKQSSGSGMFIPDLTFFHPGSELFSIPDPGSAWKNLNISTQKMVSNLYEILSELFIPDPDPGSGFWVFTHPGSRGQKGTGSGSATLPISSCFVGLFFRRARGGRDRIRRSQRWRPVQHQIKRKRWRHGRQHVAPAHHCRHCSLRYSTQTSYTIFFNLGTNQKNDKSVISLYNNK